ncbi:MAG: nickel-dependent hydrogenase large subunit [Dehalococcoidia bacterium]|nr:nickel-dependent hydrogenase large subunit [Dehalococcoidia bacterium]
MTRIVIDPLTRIEGHLKIEVEVENGKVVDAWSAGMMARGWEVLLKDRDPRDAPYLSSRVCGVCEGVHTVASAQALDHAFGAEIPEAGRIMRNLFCSGLYMHDHFIHFYVLSALDYLDIMAVASYNGSDPGLRALRDKIAALAKNKDTSPFTPRYKLDEFCVTDPETVTTLVSHYVKAVEMKAKSSKMLNIICGIQPNPATIMAGGCTATPSVEELREFRTLWEEQLDFVENVYLKDVIAVGTGPLLPLALNGFGGDMNPDYHGNYMCYPMFPQDNPASEADYSFGGSNHLVKGGVIFNTQLNATGAVDYGKITESVTTSWYDYPAGVDNLHPSEGLTKFNPNKPGAYSFIKAPRYDGQPMEVGPLARGLVNQFPELMDLINAGAKPGAIARHFCRAIESRDVGRAGLAWIDRLIELASKGPIVGMNDKKVPRSARGMGVWDAPRGALGHWIEIEDHRIKNYQLVVPSTWNASPRDEKSVRGTYEQALIGTPVPDVDNPINLVRIIRSFDPCLACAIHLIDPETNDIKVYKVA